MSQNLQKVSINGTEYNIDIDAAIDAGILKKMKKHISSFSTGDVFQYGNDPTRNDLYAIIVRINHNIDHSSLYVLLGASDNGLTAWSTDTKYALTYNEMLSYLNRSPYSFCGNVKNNFNILLQNTNPKLLIEQKPDV